MDHADFTADQLIRHEAEITRLTEELDALKNQDKGNTSRAVVLENKISKLEKQNAVSEGIILNLEATKPIKRLLERERKAAYAEGVLAGQMAQGKDDAPKLRRAEAKLEAQKQILRRFINGADYIENYKRAL